MFRMASRSTWLPKLSKPTNYLLSEFLANLLCEKVVQLRGIRIASNRFHLLVPRVVVIRFLRDDDPDALLLGLSTRLLDIPLHRSFGELRHVQKYIGSGCRTKMSERLVNRRDVHLIVRLHFERAHVKVTAGYIRKGLETRHGDIRTRPLPCRPRTLLSGDRHDH